MPSRKVSAKKFQLLQKNWEKIRPKFDRFKSLDPRSKTGNVRQIYGLAVKRVHSGTARQTIDKIQSKVELHNQKYRSTTYELLFPFAREIDKKHLAMPKVNAPTVAEILHFKTRQALDFFARIKSKHNVSEEQLKKAYELVNNRTNNFFFMPDLLLVGFKDGRFLFLPTMDLY